MTQDDDKMPDNMGKASTPVSSETPREEDLNPPSGKDANRLNFFQSCWKAWKQPEIVIVVLVAIFGEPISVGIVNGFSWIISISINNNTTYEQRYDCGCSLKDMINGRCTQNTIDVIKDADSDYIKDLIEIPEYRCSK